MCDDVSPENDDTLKLEYDGGFGGPRRTEWIDEALTILRRAGHLCPPPSGVRHPDQRPLSAARHCRANLLRLEKEVCASRRQRTSSAAPTRGIKQPIEAAGRGSLPRYTPVVRGAPKNSLRPARRRELAQWFRISFSVNCARACRGAYFGRASWYRKIGRVGRRINPPSGSAFRMWRRSDLALAISGFGSYCGGGWLINRKRVRRLYRLEGLQLCRRVRWRKPMALHRRPAPVPVGPHERWSMDFVHDTLADGRPFRILTVVDHGSRSSPMPRGRISDVWRVGGAGA